MCRIPAQFPRGPRFRARADCDASLTRIREEILEAIDVARLRAGELAEQYVAEAFGDTSGLKELFRPRFSTPPDGGDDDDHAPRRRGGVIG